MTGNATHKLSETVLNDLKNDRLRPVLDAVTGDHTLHLGIREGYLTIYYRGGQLIAIKGAGPYSVDWDRNYDPDSVLGESMPTQIRSEVDAKDVVSMFGVLKGLMDRHAKIQSGSEREFQQLVARVNNRSRSARSSHYFITDVEHAAGDARFDMLGVKWHHSERRKGDVLVPVIFEMKYGEGQLTGKASMEQHLRDALAYIDSSDGYEKLRANVETQFAQMLLLGLFAYEPSKSIVRYCTVDKKVQIVFVLAEYPPHSQQLFRLLDTFESIVEERNAQRSPSSPDVTLLFAAASLCGYALFEENMLSANTLRKRLSDANPKVLGATDGEGA